MRIRALVVDDDPAMCELIEAVLGSAGVEASALTNSSQAADRLKKEKFDAVFLDVNMPSPDGIELARKMRNSGFNLKTPIIMITGEEDPAVLERAFKAGANFFLFKPVNRGRILRVIQANQQLANRVLELQRRSNEITGLSEMGNLLQTCQTPDEAYNVIRSSAHRLFLGGTGALCLLGTSRNLLETVAAWGEPPRGERVFAPEDCWALRRGQIHRFEAGGRTGRCRHVNEGSVSESLCVPLLAQGEALGILHLQQVTRTDDGHQETAHGRFGEVEQRLAAVLAEQIALALANLNLKESLRKQSIRDPLTGLFNRRYMEESLERELRRAVRKHAPLGVAMLDLDHFKQFNDKFGHDAGDALLCDIGKLLRARLRVEDIVCRYGGEEFTLILPDASLENVRERAEQLREEIKSLEIRWESRQVGSFTLSIGVAAFPEHGSSPESLLKAADRALYRAKSEGRDRVIVALAADLKPA